MPNARMLGAYIRQKMEERNVSVSSVASLLGCQEVEAERFLCGRILATYPQMKQIAEYLGLSVHELLRNTSQLEEDTPKKKVLDIIWDYMDVRDAVLCYPHATVVGLNKGLLLWRFFVLPRTIYLLHNIDMCWLCQSGMYSVLPRRRF